MKPVLRFGCRYPVNTAASQEEQGRYQTHMAPSRGSLNLPPRPRIRVARIPHF